MYESFFWLIERPFSIAPDPQYLYLSRRHKEAMAHLSYGVSQGSCFIVLTGEVGTGKTTLCRNLIEELPDNIDIALLLNPNIDENELLQIICDELKISYKEGATNKILVDNINAHLLKSFADNRRTVLIIDEAQELSRNVLEQIRLLTNLETNKAKLLQIVLIGQPELNDLLSRNDLRQLSQRITARYHLGPLHKSEIEEYINFRLAVAGGKQPLFSRQAINKLYQLTDGIPRKINVLADHSLLAAYSKEQRLVDAKTVKQASKEVFVSSSKDASSSIASAISGSSQQTFLRRNRWWLLAAALLLLNIIAWGFLNGFSFNQNSEPLAKPAIERKLSEQAVEESNIESSAIENASAVTERQDTATEPEQQQESAQQPDSTEQVLDSETETLPQPKAGSVVYQDLSGDAESLAAEVQPEATAIPESMSLASILETSSDQASRIKAFRVLSGLWQKEFPEVALQPACELVNQQGLLCKSFTQWEQLKRYNRPAILVLVDEHLQYRVVVNSIDNGSANILIGNRSYQVPESELRARWSGRGVIFWKPQMFGAQFLQLGDNSDNLPALKKSINKQLQNVNLATLTDLDSTQFGPELSSRLQKMQTKFGIIADGRIGDETYLLLNELEFPDTTPVLSKQR